MIRYFSKSFISRYLILLLLLTLCCLPTMIDSESFFDFPNETLSIGSHTSNVLNIFFTVFLPVLLAASVFALNMIAVKQGFTGMISTLTMFLYLLFLSSFSNYFSANKLILISFVLILLLQSIMTFHERDDSIKNALNAGIYVGFASVFYPPAIFMIAIIWFGILLHRVNNWRPFIASLLGVLSNYMLLFSWYFITDRWEEEGIFYYHSIVPTFDWNIQNNITEVVVMILLLIIGLAISFKIVTILGEKSINLRRNLLLLVIAFFLITGISIVFNDLSFFAVAGIPVSLMAAHIFSTARHTLWTNRFLMVVTTVVIISHLFRLYHAV